MTHKSVDFKSSAVKHYLENNKSMDNVCHIFGCAKSSLKRWVDRYSGTKNLTRRNRVPIAYKINKDHMNHLLSLLKKNEQITMSELLVRMKEKFPNFDITPQHLGTVLRDNNMTRKRTRHEHFPKERYKKPIDKMEEMNAFYSAIQKYPLEKIICLDETSVGSGLKPTYSRCYLGKRCIIKTDNSFVFKKFTLLVAINNMKCVGHILYEKGGMTKERLYEFLEKYVFSKVKNYLIVLDNAGSHNNQYIKDAITKSGNQYLYAVPYTPKTNSPIEQFFNQIKHTMKKNRTVENYEQLNTSVLNAIQKVKPENYRNYFQYAYGSNTYYQRKNSTRKRPLKKYKEVHT